MKKRIALIMSIILVMISTSSCSGVFFGNKDSNTLILATEAGFVPYEYTDDGRTVIGVDIDIANDIADALGKDLKIVNMTFDGALLSVQNGISDFAAAGISVTEERKEMMDFSIEYATSKQVVLVKKGSDVIADIDSLEGKKLGVQAGTVGDFYCSDDIECEVKQYSKYHEAVLDLTQGRIDGIVIDDLAAQEMCKENDRIAILEGEVFTDVYAIAVKKGNTELLAQINEVLQKLMDEGKIAEYTINHTTE